MTGLVASAVILFTILFFLPYFKYLPQTTLAAIVLFAATGLIETHDFVYFYMMRSWVDMAVLAACSLMTLLAGVEVRCVAGCGHLCGRARLRYVLRFGRAGQSAYPFAGPGGVRECACAHRQGSCSRSVCRSCWSSRTCRNLFSRCTAATPTISVSTGTYYNDQTVTISNGGLGTIYYTTNG